MAVKPINGIDMLRMQQTIDWYRERSFMRASTHADVADELFERIRDTVHEASSFSQRGMHKFWSEVYRDNNFLKGLSRLLWHGADWSKHEGSLLKLLAVQNGTRQRDAARAMKRGGEFFLSKSDSLTEAVTVGGGRWLSSSGLMRLDYMTEIKRGKKRVTAEFKVSVSPTKNGDNAVSHADITIQPKQWVDGVHSVRDANMTIKVDGATQNFKRQAGWIQIDDIRSFKGTTLRARIALTPLQSSCLSIAILQSGIHTLFIHPIGLGV